MARPAHAAPVLAAAERWREDCLVRGGSIFTDEMLWVHPNVDALVTHYVQNLDDGEGDFFQKFETQLADAPAPAIRLAAEILWVMYLIVSRTASSGATKRLQIRKVFGWSGQEIPADHWALGEVLDRGVGHPGTAYQTQRWRELIFFVEFLGRWTPLSQEEKTHLLGDPWEFSQWLEGVEGASRRQLPHILCYLLFPDSFERIATGSHKEKIVQSLGERDGGTELEYTSRTDLDRALLAVRESLVTEYGEGLDFYDDDLLGQWREEEKPPPEERDDGPGDAVWLQEHFSGGRVWILAAGEGGRVWPEFEQDGIAAVGWDDIGDLNQYQTRDAIQAALVEEYGKPNPTNDSLALWEFVHVMKPGDTIIARKAGDTLLAHGVVRGPYVFDNERAEYYHTRKVDWTVVSDWRIPDDRRVAIKTLTDFTNHPTWVREAFGWLDGASGGRPAGPYTIDDALRDLFLSKSDLQEILDGIARHKNLILQGPPGVGKTFVARRIAWALMGRRAPENVAFIQFHQSYAYEDLVQGFRPNPDGGFELRDGIFHRFCRKAAASSEPHVFIIDEINRGNLSRILGELMMLIEADKRGPEHAIPLTYAPDEDPFYVPDNVHVLGMMNTADRSLAMVDYALRRRFAFFTLRPAFGSEAFSEYLVDAGVGEDLVRLIDQRFGALNKAIGDDVQNLGPGFEIGHSYFVPSGEEASLDEHWYRTIVRTQILPLLGEYWPDRPKMVADHAAALGVT